MIDQQPPAFGKPHTESIRRVYSFEIECVIIKLSDSLTSSTVYQIQYSKPSFFYNVCPESVGELQAAAIKAANYLSKRRGEFLVNIALKLRVAVHTSCGKNDMGFDLAIPISNNTRLWHLISTVFQKKQQFFQTVKLVRMKAMYH